MLYDYRCDSCNIEFEEVRSIDERYDVSCPKCGERVRKLVNTKLSTSIFPEGYWHNIAPYPIYVRTAKQLAEECRKRWTPSNRPWPEFLDGISNPGVPYDVKQKEVEGNLIKEELCRIKTKRLAKMASPAAIGREMKGWSQ